MNRISRLVAFSLLGLLPACAAVPEVAQVDGYRIEVRTVAAQPVVTMRRRVKTSNLSSAFAQCLPAAFSAAQASGTAPVGQPVAIYHWIGADEVDVEMGCPVAEAVAGRGEVQSRVIPGGRALVTSHFGSYQSLGKAHAALESWIAASGATRNGPCWEVYVSDPTQTAPQEVRTDVYYPIR